MRALEYSIVIPVYNEAARIAKNIDEIFAFFLSTGKTCEVIFVNDGSMDETGDVLREFQKKYSFQIVEYRENRGKGYAVRQGVLKAKGEWVVFFDIDLATPLAEFTRFVSFQSPGDQIIIGSRRLERSQIKNNESALRVFLGQGFSLLSRFFVGQVSDFTCGFKCFSAAAAKQIFSLARINRWAFDTEILYIARLHNIPIREMPVTWSHDEHSKVRVFKDIVTSGAELFRIVWNKWRGRY